MTTMMTTEQKHLEMFGCSREELDAMIDSPITKLCGLSMLAISILSDAQEMIARGDVETGRQFINRAKHVVIKKSGQSLERAAKQV